MTCQLVQPVGTVPHVPTAARRSDAVHDRLRAQILDGSLAPGDPLPSERTLSEDFGVNRHAVREAVKRLEQAGLVRVTHGGATRVLDWREHGGLDLIQDLGPALWPAAAEMRVTIGADAARLCARHSPDAGLRDLVEQQAGGRTFAARLDAYERMWARIVGGSRNVAYRLAFNSLVAARHADGFDATVYAAEVDDAAAAGRLAAAIEAGESDAAEAIAKALLQRSLAGG